MTEQYKVGDKVLVEAEVSENDNGINRVAIKLFGHNYLVSPNHIRPYTHRQEFEYGEEVEVSDNGLEWVKALYIGKNNNHNQSHPYFVNPLREDGSPCFWDFFKHCRKLTTKKETITIGGVDYYKDDVEKALKDLKPVGESK